MTDQSQIRNISIIAHIDHGKTTLTDRLLMATNTITAREFHDRLLDSNPIEQERGITIKLAPVRLNYVFPEKLQSEFPFKNLTINLIDTPGHVDFGYEVSRSLAACEGAVLLVDATQGIQAQTLVNFEKAQKLNLSLVVALNKIDLPSADLEAVTRDLVENFHLEPDKIVPISAKTGQNLEQLFAHIARFIPAPSGIPSDPPKALVFNSLYHPHKGVIAFVKVVSGTISNQNLMFYSNSQSFTPKELGSFSPQMTPSQSLETGQVGYIATGFKDPKLVTVGDTITLNPPAVNFTPLPGYKQPQSVVYMDVFPVESQDHLFLEEAIGKLALNDAALTYSGTFSQALGKGFRMGFLGVLHAEIVLERIKREYNLDLIPTTPTVVYHVTTTKGEELVVKNPAELPDETYIKEIKEPLAQVKIFTPKNYLGAIMQLGSEHRGDLIEQHFFSDKIRLEYLLPLSELITHFYDQLKSVSQGYASLEYELFDYQPVDAVKLSILINKEPVEALSQIVVRSKAHETGKRVVTKLKTAIPRSLNEVVIQAAIGGTIVARETVKAYRKDVTAKLYGGDITRRMKLLDKQKKGKKYRSQFARVNIPQSAYLEVLKL
jgi:GTP-binding protein LepA